MFPLEDKGTVNSDSAVLVSCETVTLGTESLQERLKTLLIYPESLSPETVLHPLSVMLSGGAGTRGTSRGQSPATTGLSWAFSSYSQNLSQNLRVARVI